MTRNLPYVRHRETPRQRLDKAAEIQRVQRTNLLRDKATRARFPKAWAAFLTTEALPDTWARTLSMDGGVAIADRDCNVVHLLEHAPHPPWVVVPEDEFDDR